MTLPSTPNQLARPSASVATTRTRVGWVDAVKALALIWIVLNHIAERLFGSPYLGNPSTNWLSLAERVAQLAPITRNGLVADIVANAVRYVGWLGDQGVGLFIFVSGFGLAWTCLASNSGARIPLLKYFQRRAERIYPMWWVAHLAILVLMVFLPVAFGRPDLNFALSFLGIRATLGTFYYLSPAWWYVGLLIQLYLVFPLLWYGMTKWGVRNFVVVSVLIALVVRAIGLFTLDTYLDAWSRGAIFITRLPEFVLGMGLAAWFYRYPELAMRRLRGVLPVVGAIVGWGLATALSLTLPGMIVAPFLQTAALSILLLNVLAGWRPHPKSAMGWLANHSFSIYLTHHLAILTIIPAGGSLASLSVLIAVGIALVASIVSALVLETISANGIRALKVVRTRVGWVGLAVGAAAACVAVGVFAVGVEIVSRELSPQEYLGWGERPSLEPDPIVGWHLIPNSVTRLRWQSYDYTVTANSLGFPGPEYAIQNPANTLRIMTTGDAFTSAEGVDTDKAWPRLLEHNLTAETGSPVEVLNFAITGYGPNQYEAVVEEYAPIYHPDVIIISFYVNEYQDVLYSNERFQNAIGFQLPSQSGVGSIVGMNNFKAWFDSAIYQPLRERLTGVPNPHGYALGQFAAFDPEALANSEAVALVYDRLEHIKAVANRAQVPVLLLLVPASIQVCSPGDLAYFPQGVALNDTAHFDLDLPQRTTIEIATELGLQYADLRSVLQGDTCLYQPHNMHWLPEGHQRVAERVAALLRSLTSSNGEVLGDTMAPINTSG